KINRYVDARGCEVGAESVKGLYLCFRCDQHVVAEGCVAGGDAEQGAEGGLPGAAAVEAEDELIEVGLNVLATPAVIDAERPDLEVGENAVHPRLANMR